jgi:hypothetical protein
LEINGYYKIEIIDNSDNKTILDDSLLSTGTNYISFTPKPIYNFGTADFNQSLCANITIHNLSEKDVEIPDILMSKNLDFSIPQSQFPLLIPAKDSIDLEVCFKARFPLYGIYRDTLTYFKDCVFARIALAAEIDTTKYVANSRCDVIINIVTNYDTLSNPEPILYPNPNTGLVWINSNNKKGDISLEIYNIFGEQIKSLQLQAKELPIKIDVSDLVDGNYIFVLQQNNTINIKKILIIK